MDHSSEGFGGSGERSNAPEARDFPWAVLSWLGAYVVFAVGTVHLLQSDEMVKSGAVPYALLFLVNFLASCVAAASLALRGASSRWPWLLGAAVCALSFAGFFISRVLGLPGLPASEELWFSLPGAISVLLEAAFLGVAGLFLTRSGRRVVAVEQRIMQREEAPREIENEMRLLRESMAPEMHSLARKTEHLPASAGRSARERVTSFVSRNRERLGVAGVAALVILALLGRRR